MTTHDLLNQFGQSDVVVQRFVQNFNRNIVVMSLCDLLTLKSIQRVGVAKGVLNRLNWNGAVATLRVRIIRWSGRLGIFVAGDAD